jgi:Concanavalin A-like lectin/glucanases superfamily
VFNSEFSGSQEGGWTTNPGSLKFNSWHHYVLTYNSSAIANVATFYLDGVANNGTPVQPASGTYNSDAGNTLVMGDYDPADAPADPLDGMLDDVRMYKRILSTTEITRLYQLGAQSSHAVNTSLATSNTLSKSSGGLVGWWTFDGKNMLQNIADSSGNGNNGHLVNFTSTTTVLGKIGQALSMSGMSVNTGHVEVPHVSAMDITGDITLAGWFKTTDPVNQFDSVIFAKTDGATNWDYEFGTTGQGANYGKVYFWASVFGGTVYRSTSAVTLNTQWHHIAVTRAGSVITFYIDGVAAGSASDGTALAATNFPLWFGNDQTIAFPSVKSFDDVRLYSRALSSTEVTRLYRLGQ